MVAVTYLRIVHRYWNTKEEVIGTDSFQKCLTESPDDWLSQNTRKSITRETVIVEKSFFSLGFFHGFFFFFWLKI